MLLRALLPAALVLLLGACTKSQPGSDGPSDQAPQKFCTDIGCLDGLRVQVNKATPWPAGKYTFGFTLDGAKVTCSGALPLRACEQGHSLTCDVAEKVQIGESGCALPPDQHGFSDIQIFGAPTAVKIDVVHEGNAIGGLEVKPTYTESRPNGPDCEPVCHGASVELDLP